MPKTAKHWDSKRYTVYRDQFMKTQLCRYYAAGTCTKGADCGFAHGTEQLGQPPDLRKTALCEDFAKGKCPLPSNECIYAHGPHELRSSPAFQAMRKEAPPKQAAVAAVKEQHDAEKGQTTVPPVPKIALATRRKKLRSPSGSSNSSGASTSLGSDVPALHAFAKTVPQPVPQHPRHHHQKQVNQGQNNTKQQLQLLEALGALNNPSSGLPTYQPSLQGGEMEPHLLSIFQTLNEMAKVDPSLASRLAPPGLPLAGKWPDVASPRAEAMAEHAFDLEPKNFDQACFDMKQKNFENPIYDDEPWTDRKSVV